MLLLNRNAGSFCSRTSKAPCKDGQISAIFWRGSGRRGGAFSRDSISHVSHCFSWSACASNGWRTVGRLLGHDSVWGPAWSTESLRATARGDDRPPGTSQAAAGCPFPCLLGPAIAPSPWLVAAEKFLDVCNFSARVFATER